MWTLNGFSVSIPHIRIFAFCFCNFDRISDFPILNYLILACNWMTQILMKRNLAIDVQFFGEIYYLYKFISNRNANRSLNLPTHILKFFKWKFHQDIKIKERKNLFLLRLKNKSRLHLFEQKQYKMKKVFCKTWNLFE